MEERSSIKINFKYVCHGCKYRESYLKEDVLYSDNERYVVNTIIGCEHEKVCMWYMKSED